MKYRKDTNCGDEFRAESNSRLTLGDLRVLVATADTKGYSNSALVYQGGISTLYLKESN